MPRECAHSAAAHTHTLTTHAHTNPHAHNRTHARAHARTHKGTHASTHSHAHAHAHAHARSEALAFTPARMSTIAQRAQKHDSAASTQSCAAHTHGTDGVHVPLS